MASSSKKLTDLPLPYVGTYLPQGAPDADADAHNVYLDEEAPVESFGDLKMCHYSGYHGGVSDRVFTWIENHDAPLRPLVEKVSLAVAYVPFNTFKHDLIVTYNDMIRQLTVRYAGRASGKPFTFRDDAIVLVEGGKSNKWAAEIVLNETKDVPFAYIRLGEKKGREFLNFLKSLDKLHPSRKAEIIAQFKDKTLILSDDGSYSGQQLHDHLVAIKSANVDHNLQINCVAVMIPNMTRFAKGVLNTFIGANPLLTVIVAAHNEIQTLHSLTEPAGGFAAASLAVQRQVTQDRKQLADMWFKGDLTLLEKVGLIWGWAGHKVPNDVSFPEPLRHGSVFDAKGASKGKALACKLIPPNGPCYKALRDKTQFQLSNFFRVTGTKSLLYRGALPNLEGMRMLVESVGIKVMVSLREKPYEADQASFLSERGVKVVHIPFDYNKPDIKQVMHFVATFLVAHRANEKIFVHCRHGADRTGVMVAAVKLVGGRSSADAIEEMLNPKYGFHRLTHPNLVDFVMGLNAAELKTKAAALAAEIEKRDSSQSLEQGFRSISSTGSASGSEEEGLDESLTSPTNTTGTS